MTTWTVQLKGGWGPDSRGYELAVIHKDNIHGRASWGWGDERKIILFSSGTGGNYTRDEAFAVGCAQALCDYLNSKEAP